MTLSPGSDAVRGADGVGGGGRAERQSRRRAHCLDGLDLGHEGVVRTRISRLEGACMAIL